MIPLDDVPKFIAFTDEIINLTRGGLDLDGYDVEVLGVKHGVLKRHEKQVPCGENCNCLDYAERGETVTCLVKTYNLEDEEE